MDFGIILLGLLVGFLVGLTSAGTGSLGTTLLFVFYGDPATPPYYPGPVIVGSSTLQGAAMKGVGTVRNWLDKTLRSPYATWVVVPALPFTVAGALTTEALFAVGLFEPILAAVLLVAAGFMVLEATVRKRAAPHDMPPLDRRYKRSAVLLGASIGFVAGLTSVGTGTLTISALILLLRVPAREAASIAILTGVFIFLFGAVSHLFQSHIDFVLAGLLLVGAVPGILLGTRLRGQLDPEPLRIAIAVVIALASGRLLIKFFTGSNFFGF